MFFSLSSIGSGAIKSLPADYNPEVPLLVTRATVKVRTMGTNTYIAIGDRHGQVFRLTSAGDSKTYPAQVKNGSEIPFDLLTFRVVGDNAANDGVLEIEATEAQ